MEKEIIYLPIKTTKDAFTIGACGKFNEEKKHLSKAEATYLYLKLHEWLFEEEIFSEKETKTELK
jgi:hypothetical protein